MQNHHLLLDSEAIRIYYNLEDNWIYAGWIGEYSLERIQFGCENILKFLVTQHCTKIVSDHRQRTGIWINSTDWVRSNWMPRAEKAGLNKMALVYSSERFARLSADKAIEGYKGHISMLAFKDLETAESWLRFS